MEKKITIEEVIAFLKDHDTADEKYHQEEMKENFSDEAKILYNNNRLSRSILYKRIIKDFEAKFKSPEEEKKRTIQGPFGDYLWGSSGALLNAMVRNENIPIITVERCVIEDGKITIGGNMAMHGKQVGNFRWFEGIDHPLFVWLNEEFKIYRQHKFILHQNGILPKFRLTLSCNHMAAFEIDGTYATPELHEFLKGMLTNRMDDPRYKIHSDSGAFFQGGSHDPDGQWFLIEFWKPAGAQAFIDYMNEHYIHKE